MMKEQVPWRMYSNSHRMTWPGRGRYVWREPIERLHASHPVVMRLPALAIDRPLAGHVPGLPAVHTRDSERFETDDQPVDLRIGVGSAEVALRQVLDVVVGTVESRVVQLGLYLGPTEHVLWVQNQQRGARIALQVKEP